MCLVQCFQLGAAGVVGFCHLPLQNFQPFPVVVQSHEQPFQLVLIAGKAGGKCSLILRILLSFSCKMKLHAGVIAKQLRQDKPCIQQRAEIGRAHV